MGRRADTGRRLQRHAARRGRRLGNPRQHAVHLHRGQRAGDALPDGSNTPSVDYFIPGTSGPLAGIAVHRFRGQPAGPLRGRSLAGQDIAAGSVSDEIVHEMDLFPTFARIAGGKVPDDRSHRRRGPDRFFPGRAAEVQSRGADRVHGERGLGREVAQLEGPPEGAGEHIDRARSITGCRAYTTSTRTRSETQNVLFPETWVPKAALGQLGAHVFSLRQEPPIAPGTPDPYEPPQK